MFYARVWRRCRVVRPKTRRGEPPALTEAFRGNKDNKQERILLQGLDDIVQVTPNVSLSGRQLWNFSKLIRENQRVRRSHGACLVGGSAVIQRIWREYKIRPNVVYVPDTEATVPAWCLEEELPSCVVRCPPVDVNKQLLSAEWADGHAAEFPIPTHPSLEMFLGENKVGRLASMLVLVGLRIPSNVGVLIRAAVDMGYESVLLEDCVDLFNEKVLRSSGGAVFSPNIKLFQTSGTAISCLSKIALDHRLLPLLAVPAQNAESVFAAAKRFHSFNAAERHRQNTSDETAKNHVGPLLILGSESRGLESLAGEWPVPHHVVSVPLPNSAIDSINVSVAGSVLLHAFRPAAEKSFAALASLDAEGRDCDTPALAPNNAQALGS